MEAKGMAQMPHLLAGGSQGGVALRRSTSAAKRAGFISGPSDVNPLCQRPVAPHLLPPLKPSGGPSRDFATSLQQYTPGAACRSEPERDAPAPVPLERRSPPKSNSSSRARRTPKVAQHTDHPQFVQGVDGLCEALPASRAEQGGGAVQESGSPSFEGSGRSRLRDRSKRVLAWDISPDTSRQRPESLTRRSSDSRRAAACALRRQGSGSTSGSFLSGPPTPSASLSPDKCARREATDGRQEAPESPTTPAFGKVGPNWVRGCQVGSGSFGSVSRAFDPETGLIFAVKQVTVDADESARKSLEEELRIVQDLQHPHIVTYLGHRRMGTTIQIYLEYCSGGSMASLLAEFGPLEERMLSRATAGMLKGLAYLHDHKPCVLHRDIKGGNLLVSHGFKVKLADFGCSKRAFESRSFRTIGSLPWMAPEVIRQTNGYGRKADIWSAGCTVIEMATGEKPWGSNAFNNMAAAMMRIGLSEDTPPLPESAPAALRDFLAACVQRDPERRPQAVELLDYELLRG